MGSLSVRTIAGVFCFLIAGVGNVECAVAGEDLDREIATLRADIASFRAARAEARDDALRRSLVLQSLDGVLADLAPSTEPDGSRYSTAAGWEGAFGWRSPDSGFSLSVSAQIMIRYVLNHRSGERDLPGNPASVERGLENRRSRLVFAGTFLDASWAYQIRGSYRRSGGEFFLEDSWIRKSLGNGVSIMVGQFKPAFLREDTVSSRRQLIIERSVVCDFFRQAWAQGIQARMITDDVRLTGWFGDGIGPRSFGAVRFNSINTPWERTATAYSGTGRIDWKIDGEWWQFDDFNSPRGSPDGTMLGLAVATQRANANLGPADGTVVSALTADATLCFSGASVFVSGVVASVAPRNASKSVPWGVTAQAGVFVLDPLELYLRYEYMDADDPVRIDPETARFNGVTVGGNWFFAPEIKFSLDLVYNFASLAGSAFISNGVGFRRDAPGETGQWALRAQLQLVF